jgi:predicted aspartyl protease
LLKNVFYDVIKYMEKIYRIGTDITLENADDMALLRHGVIVEAEVRRLPVRALVDTGAWNLIINEATRAKLGLRIIGTDEVEGADGALTPCGIAEPVTIYWQDRDVEVRPLVLEQEPDVLLGAFPLEGMDLMVHPQAGKVIGAHGSKIKYIVK